MNSKTLGMRSIFISLVLLILFVFSAYAQIDVEKIKKELRVRNIYTIIENRDGNIFAGTWGAGIWKSTDIGNTWNRTSEGLLSYDIRKLIVSNSSRIFAATARGLYYTDDGGLSWIAVNQLDEKVSYRNIIINGNDVYVVTDDGVLYKSQNDGLTWFQTGKIYEPVITIPILISENKMLVGTEKGLLISEDEGKTWLKSSDEINETIKDLSLINETVYITTLSNGLFISTDYGNSISSFDNGLHQKRVKKVSSDAKGNVFATVDGELTYSLNKSMNTWQQGYSNISASSIEFITSNRDGRMAAVTSGGEILFSNDAGMNWTTGSQLICVIPNTRFIEVDVSNEWSASDETLKFYTPPPMRSYDIPILNYDPDSIGINSASPSQMSNSSTINVTYINFTPEAQAAFQHAVNIWASLLSSNVVINVQASFSPLSATALGAAGPTAVYNRFNHQPIQNTYYPIALAEKINGDRLNLPSEPDIIATLNSSFPSWYFGTDGNPPSNQYDLVSVALHELCHGLGYSAGFDYSGGIGSWTAQFPFVFDRFLFNGNNEALLNSTLFPDSSQALGGQLTSDNIFWNGTNIAKAKMYAPTTFVAGSSISHLDDATYPPESNNNLMTHALRNGVATHLPGNVVMAQMSDMGWEAIATPVYYNINGTIRDINNRAISGVTVTLSGNTSRTTTTDINGSYTFLNLLAGGNYTITPLRTNYSFNPTNRTINLNSNQTADFTGTGIPAISLSPSLINYGEVRVAQHKDSTITITNSGAEDLIITSLEITGADNSSFTIVDKPSLPLTIQSSNRSYITIRFTPNNATTKNAKLSIINNAINTEVTLTGIGTSSVIWNQNKTSIAFQPTGFLSEPTNSILIVSNSSNTDILSITSASYSGTGNLFSINEVFPININPNSQKDIMIRFNPEVTGNFSGTFEISNNSSNSPVASLAVSGTVLGSIVEFNLNDINYGAVGVSSIPIDTTITIKNDGTYKLLISSLSITSQDTSYTLATQLPNGGYILEAGEEFNIGVRLTPKTIGVKNGTLTINNNSSNSPTITINLTASVQQPYITLSPPSLDFGISSVEKPSDTMNLVLTNTFPSSLKIESLKKTTALITIKNSTITGDTVSFKILNNRTDFSISAGSSDTIRILFFPKSSGQKTATLIITSDDIAPVQTVQLSGIGAGKSIITSNHSTINFGDHFTGTYKDTSVIITNTGNLDLLISSKTFEGQYNASFSFLSTNKDMLTHNESDTLQIRFASNLPGGTKIVQLGIHNNSSDTPIYEINLSANTTYSEITKSVSRINFDTTNVGSKSDTTFYIRNSGNADLIISRVNVDGNYARDFMTGENYDLTIIKPNEVKYFNVSFIPSDTALRYAIMRFYSNDQKTPQDLITLMGVGIIASLPNLSLSVDQIEFPTVELGQFSDTSLTIRNSGNGVLIIDSLNIIGTNKGDFLILDKPFPYSIQSGNSDVLFLRYQPTVENASATLRIKSNDEQEPVVEVSLLGNSTKPIIFASDSVINFGNINVGESFTKSITITNSGNAPLILSEIKLNGHETIFDMATSSIPIELTTNDECDINITFKPTDGITYNAVLSISSNDIATPLQNIMLIGVGASPNMILSQRVDFGKVMSGNSKESGFRISNSGNTTLTITAINITGSNANEFSINKTFPYNIMEAQSDSVSVWFNPNVVGIKDAKIIVTSNDKNAINEIQIIAEATDVISVDNINVLPSSYSLEQNYPNPFNPSTKIKYAIKDAGFVSIQVFDIFGREIKNLVNLFQPSGNYEITFDAVNLTSGIYYYKLNINNFTETKKMLLLK